MSTDTELVPAEVDPTGQETIDHLETLHGELEEAVKQTQLYAEEALVSVLQLGATLGEVFTTLRSARPVRNVKEWCEANCAFGYQKAVQYVRIYRELEPRLVSDGEGARLPSAEEDPEFQAFIGKSLKELLPFFESAQRKNSKRSAGGGLPIWTKPVQGASRAVAAALEKKPLEDMKPAERESLEVLIEPMVKVYQRIQALR